MYSEEDVCRQIIVLAKRKITLEMRYFALSLGELGVQFLQESPPMTTGTDGVNLYYNTKWLLHEYSAKNGVERVMVHSLLHCIFRHFKRQTDEDAKRRWDLACDIFVNNIIDDYTAPVFSKNGKNDRIKVYNSLKKDIKILTAERIYKHLKGIDDEKTLKELEGLFIEDEHTLWQSSDIESVLPRPINPEGDSVRDMWKRVEEDLLGNLMRDAEQSLSSNGELIKQLKVNSGKKYDYKKFLSRFLSVREVIKSSDEEFDYIYYYYGLEMYKDLPLIENLEYSDMPVAEDIVVVIDTSMSTQGDLVLTFLRQTYAMIEQIYTKNRAFRLLLLQCDSAVRCEKIICSYSEFENVMNSFTLIGGGGTDFRPAFERVNKMIEDKTLNKVKGFIYFTDGKGVYPENAPPYESVFVFYDDEKNNYDVPFWAYKIILDEDDINEYC